MFNNLCGNNRVKSTFLRKQLARIVLDTVVVKVDFDLTLTLLAHNLYRKLASGLPGYEQCTVDTLHRMIIQGRSIVKIEEKNMTVTLCKRVHMPVLFELPWFNTKTKLSLLNRTIEYKIGTSS